MDKKEKTYWFIRSFSFAEAVSIDGFVNNNRIEIKLPKHIKKCIGVYFSVSSCHGSQRLKIADIKLSFNNNKSTPISQEIWYNSKIYGKKIEVLSLNEVITENSIISSYITLSDEISTTKIKIYFKCIS